MKRHIWCMTVCCLVGLLFAWPSTAQNTSKFSFNIGGGFTEPVRDFGRLDTGFNITAGAGVNFVPNFGLIAEFGYNHL